MKEFIITFSFLLLSFAGKSQVQLTKEIDPDIVIINIGDGDRTFIGNLLSKVDSCNPVVIGMDIRFAWALDNYQDSVLQHAFSKTNKEIIAYSYNKFGTSIVKTIPRFDSVVTKGLAFSYTKRKLVTYFSPYTKKKGKIHEHFAIKVVERWSPNCKFNYEVDKKIPILYKRKLEQFVNFEGSELNVAQHAKLLKGKIVILGYIGPSKEDKHFTPIRLTEKFAKKNPDTFGVVILANEIRMVLDACK